MGRQRSPNRGRKPAAVEAKRHQLDLWTGAPEPEKPQPAPQRPAKAHEKQPVTDLSKSAFAQKPNPVSSTPIKVTVSRPLEPRRISAGGAPALTRRQHQILDHLRRREASGQHPPSLSELCSELDVVSRGSMHKQIAALIEAGLIEPMARKHRGVRLLSLPPDGGRRVPLLGVIAAGHPIEALAQSEALSLPEAIVTAPGCYALAVRGDSMRDIGILDGDTVVVEPRHSARNGEVVVALIDGVHATLKRIEQLPGEVRLHAENPAHAVQRYRPDQVTIQGIVVAQFRRYR